MTPRHRSLAAGSEAAVAVFPTGPLLVGATPGTSGPASPRDRWGGYSLMTGGVSTTPRAKGVG